jgi:hypothetical protein
MLLWQCCPRYLEERNAALKDAEGLLKELVLLHQRRVVEHDLRRRDLELEDLLVDGLGRLERTDALLEVDKERPELGALPPPGWVVSNGARSSQAIR